MIKIAQTPPVNTIIAPPDAALTRSNQIRGGSISPIDSHGLAKLIGRSATHPKQAAAAKSGLQKITRFVSMMAGGDSLLNGMARLMAENGKANEAQTNRCESEVRSAFGKKRTQTMSQLKQMEKKAEKEKSLGFWDKLLNVVKSVVEGIAAVGVAAVGIAGGLAAGAFGVISALATGASIVVSHVVKTADGAWASMGLSLGGGLLGGLTYAMGGDAAVKGGVKGVKGAFDKLRGVVSGGVEVARDVDNSQLKAAESDLLRTETGLQRTKENIDENVSNLRDLVRTLEAFTDLIRKGLKKDEASAVIHAASGR
jgi:hypothetical protein